MELHARGIFAVVGGPWITVAEDWFDGLVDVIFVGEAEETWPQFLEEWKQGLHQYRYEQAEKTDMAKVPMPRYDLVKFQRIRDGLRPDLARLPVPVRVLRHHRHLRPQAPDQDARDGRRRDRRPAQARGPGDLPGRRQLHRQQEGRQGDPPGDHRLAAQARLPAGLLHRGVARPRRGRRADAADGRGRDGRRLHRDREPRRGGPPRDQEVPERPRRDRRPGPEGPGRTAWRSTPG